MFYQLHMVYIMPLVIKTLGGGHRYSDILTREPKQFQEIRCMSCLIIISIWTCNIQPCCHIQFLTIHYMCNAVRVWLSSFSASVITVYTQLMICVLVVFSIIYQLVLPTLYLTCIMVSIDYVYWLYLLC